MEHLTGALRAYPWGSRTLLAELRGTASPASQPEAELWFGAHPAGPATVGERGLDDIIAEDPVGALGQRVVDTFGPQLPFLVKLLAAAEPLSIQAHPSREQAEEGFARENALGVALDDPRRNYKDPNPKPELIVALTPFRALAGFRPPAQTAELFQALRVAELDRYASMLPADGEGDMRALFTTLISLPGQARATLLDAVGEAARRLVAGNEGDGEVAGWIRDAASVFIELTQRYPGDVGALAALLLNVVNLEPGEAAYLGAGQLHAYLSGLGVEVMANSDNVLRGGLTPKHVDVPELVRVLDFTPLASPRAVTEETIDGTRFTLPVKAFDVTVSTLREGQVLKVASDGPSIVLCTQGRVRSGEFELGPGDAVWIPASEGEAVFSTVGETPAQLFHATA